MEVCVDNLESAVAAEKGGAARIELCAALSEGGLTPSPGFMSTVKSAVDLPVYAMIRCRGGDFVYSQPEMNIMAEDVHHLRREGADGFVFGAVSANGAIDAVNSDIVFKAMRPSPVTFHRAFDVVTDPITALKVVEALGCARVLTSGLAPTAYEGIPVLRSLTSSSVIVMPGAGLNPGNLLEVLSATNAKEFHGSAKVLVQRNGLPIHITDEQIVRKMTNIYKQFHGISS